MPPHVSVRHRANPPTYYENRGYPRYHRGLSPTDGRYPWPQTLLTSLAEKPSQGHQSREQSGEQKDFYHSQ